MMRRLSAVVSAAAATGLLLLALLDGIAVQAGTLTQIPPTLTGTPGGYQYGEYGYGNAMTRDGKLVTFGEPSSTRQYIYTISDTSVQLLQMIPSPASTPNYFGWVAAFSANGSVLVTSEQNQAGKRRGLHLDAPQFGRRLDPLYNTFLAFTTGCPGGTENNAGLGISGDGSTIVLGYACINGQQGAFKVFKKAADGTWVEPWPTFTPEAAWTGSNAGLGRSAALNYDGSVFVVGAMKYKDSGSDPSRGAVAVYRWQGAGYVFSQLVRPSGNYAAYSEFGYSTVFGYPNAFVSGTACRGTCLDRGAVAVFRDFGNGFVQSALQEGDPSYTTNAASLGTNVAMSSIFGDGCAHVSAGAPYEASRGQGYVYRYTTGGQVGACDYPACTDLVLARVTAPRRGVQNRTASVKLQVKSVAKTVAKGTPVGPLSVTLVLPPGAQYVSSTVLPKLKQGATPDYTTTAAGNYIMWYGAMVTKPFARTFQAKLRLPGKAPVAFDTMIYKMDTTTGLPVCRIQRPHSA